MPRTSNSTSSSRSSVNYSKSSYTLPKKYNPPITQPTVPSVSQVPSTTPAINIGQPTMWDSVKQGFGFGVGSSIARSIFEPKHEVKVVHEPSQNNKEHCTGIFELYQKCITEGTCSDDFVEHLKKSYEKCKEK
jgi:hypothetical protein